MPSRCKRRAGKFDTNPSPWGSISKIFSKIVPQVDNATFRRLLTTSLCFGASSLFLMTYPSLASDLNDGNLKSNSKIFISDNNNYDGATLPPPVKKKSPGTVSVDDTQDDASARKNRRRRIADVDTDPMSTPDAAGGVSVPLKKVQKSVDSSSVKGSGDRDFRAGGPGAPERKGHHDHDPLFGRGPLDLTPLGLTDDQKQKIAQMHTENATKMRDLLKKRHELSGQMRDTMLGADVTETQIKAKRDEVRQVQEKLEDLRLNDFLAIRAILTPEQKLKLKDVKIVEGRPHDGDGPPGQPPPRRGDGDNKRLADSPK